MNYAKERKTMGQTIDSHQAIAFMLADMATGIEAARLLTYKSAYEIDQGRSNTMFASMAKGFAADHCNKVVSDAVQVCGCFSCIDIPSLLRSLYRFRSSEALVLILSILLRSSCATPRFIRFTKAPARFSALLLLAICWLVKIWHHKKFA